jgi:hypothetical protein
VLLLLQGPVIAAVVFATGACCTGDHCHIAAHHHAAPKTEDAPMGCDHDAKHSASKARSCSMSCCDTTERSAVHSTVFVLLPVVELATTIPAHETVSSFAGRETAAVLLPLSPPPESQISLS